MSNAPIVQAGDEDLARDFIADLSRQSLHVKSDPLSRELYSTDASSYRILPAAVAIPRSADEISTAVRSAAKHGSSVVPRGGGSSLSGQTIGPGLILDCSHHLDSILDLDTEGRRVRVQAGLVLDRLNARLRPQGLMVGPDPASSMTATLGGMTGNNSTGSHSIVYGMIADHVDSLRVVLSDGSQVAFGLKDSTEAAALRTRHDLEGQLYRGIDALLDEYAEDIRSGYPKVWRHVAGYNLNRLLADREAGRPLNLAPLVVGSEGTLGVITEVTLRLVPRPRAAILAIVHFDDLHRSLAAVPAILETNPSAVELVDRYFLELTRQVPDYARRLTFIEGDPRAVLIVEYTGEEASALQDRLVALDGALKQAGGAGALVIQPEPAQIVNVWSVRKAGLGLINSMRGDAKPLAFVDDAAVPVDQLADYADEFAHICREAGTEAAFYAHASAGCLHINPLINLKTEQGLRQLRQISEGVMALAIRRGGTTTGEHGEGLARSRYNAALYGPRLHEAFRRVKGLFDPANLMNPGKIIDAPAPWDPAVLRIHPGYSAPLAPLETFLDFSSDGGFAGLVEMCSGQGVCRQLDSGVMCPSFRTTREEAHSTRGRANTLRAAMSGQLGDSGMSRRDVYEVLDLCLSCKGCKNECPSLVDVAALKAEFLAHYYEEKGTPLSAWLVGNLPRLSILAALMPGLTNAILSAGLTKSLMQALLRIDARRSFPAYAPQTFQRWFRAHQPAPGARGTVILWDDTWLNYYEPRIGQSAVALLEAAGYQVQILKERRCCGRPLISKGLLRDAKALAEHNIQLLLPFVQQGIPVLGLEPSCVSAFHDEYLRFFPGPESQQVAEGVMMIETFLLREQRAGRLDLPLAAGASAPRILIHGHCHHKALHGMGDTLDMLRLIPGAEVSLIDSTCCGMAGSFGYDHYEVSMAVGDLTLFPALRAADADQILCAQGTSCRQQIEDGVHQQTLHPIEVLAQRLS